MGFSEHRGERKGKMDIEGKFVRDIQWLEIK